MFDGLKRSDAATKLVAQLGVLHGAGQQALSTANHLSRQGNTGNVKQRVQPMIRQLSQRGGGHINEVDVSHFAGRIHGIQSLYRHAVCSTINDKEADALAGLCGDNK